MCASFDCLDMMEKGHALMEAVVDGDVRKTKELLASGAHRLGEVDGRGRTVLHLAACRGNAEILTFLLRCGADPKATDYHGNTPLHWCGHAESVDALFREGASLSIRNNIGATPKQMAQRRGVPKHVTQHFQMLEDSITTKSPSFQQMDLSQRHFERSLFQDFFNDIGIRQMIILIVSLLCLSLCVAYSITNKPAHTDKHIMIDSTSYRVEL